MGSDGSLSIDRGLQVLCMPGFVTVAALRDAKSDPSKLARSAAGLLVAYAVLAQVSRFVAGAYIRYGEYLPCPIVWREKKQHTQQQQQQHTHNSGGEERLSAF